MRNPTHPLDVLRAQVLAIQAMTEALLATIDSMQPVQAAADSPAGAEATVPGPGATRPPNAPAADGALTSPPVGEIALPKRFQTFDGPVTVPTPDAAGDLRPS